MTCVSPNATGCARLACESLTIDPVCYDLGVVWGTDNQLEVTLTDGDGKAVAINNDTVDFTVKDDLGGSVVFTKSNGPGDHSAPGLGQTIFDVDAADTATAGATTTTYWVYEVRRTTAGGDERVHLQGAFVVRPAI